MISKLLQIFDLLPEVFKSFYYSLEQIFLVSNKNFWKLQAVSPVFATLLRSLEQFSKQNTILLHLKIIHRIYSLDSIKQHFLLNIKTYIHYLYIDHHQLQHSYWWITRLKLLFISLFLQEGWIVKFLWIKIKLLY